MERPLTLRSIVIANLGLLVMIAMWGTFFPLLEFVLKTWDPMSATIGRHLMAVITLLAAIMLLDRSFPLHGRLPWRHLWLLGLIGMTISAIMTTLGVHFSSGVSAAIVAATNPITSAITARVVQRLPLMPGIIVGTLLSTAGGLIAIFGFGGTGVNAEGSGFTGLRGGEVLMIGANVVFTWYSIMAQQWMRGYSQLHITGLTAAPGLIGLLVVWLGAHWTGINPIRTDFSWPNVAILLYMGAVSVAFGNFLWHYGVSRVGVIISSMYGNLIPIIAVLMTLIWFGTAPSRGQVLGGLMIIAGVLYAQFRALRAARLRQDAAAE
jgi:drug/metabolite transporter (DMT)-like permease